MGAGAPYTDRVASLTCALGPDSAGTVLSDLLRRAQHSIDCAMYEVGPSYSWLFSSAARRGCRVRLVLDDHAGDGNSDTVARLAEAGAGCRVLGSGRAVFHPKLIVVDGETVAAGTGNLVWRDAPRGHGWRLPPDAPPLKGTREWWIVIRDSPRLARRAALLLDTAWQLAAPPPKAWRTALPEREPARVGTPLPQVAPLVTRVAGRRLSLGFGRTEVRALELAAVSAARRRVLVTVPYVRSSWEVRCMVEALAAARRRGVRTALLLGAPAEARGRPLRATGVETRVMDPARSTRGHAKGIVADDTAVVASANWSGAGLGANWEAALQTRSARAADYFAAAWERDWAVSGPLEV